MQAALGQFSDQCNWLGSWVPHTWCLLVCYRPSVMQNPVVAARTIAKHRIAMLHHNS